MSWKIRTDVPVMQFSSFHNIMIACQLSSASMHPWANSKGSIGQSELALYSSYVIMLTWIFKLNRETI